MLTLSALVSFANAVLAFEYAVDQAASSEPALVLLELLAGALLVVDELDELLCGADVVDLVVVVVLELELLGGREVVVTKVVDVRVVEVGAVVDAVPGTHCE
jgi:hypothetical protein